VLDIVVVDEEPEIQGAVINPVGGDDALGSGHSSVLHLHRLQARDGLADESVSVAMPSCALLVLPL
jgi:hypothetical protein